MTDNKFIFKSMTSMREVLFRPLDTADDVHRVLSLEVTGAILGEFVEIPKAIVEASIRPLRSVPLCERRRPTRGGACGEPPTRAMKMTGGTTGCTRRFKAALSGYETGKNGTLPPCWMPSARFARPSLQPNQIACRGPGSPRRNRTLGLNSNARKSNGFINGGNSRKFSTKFLSE